MGEIRPELDAAGYAAARAICDRADHYFARVARDPRTLRRVNFLTAEQAAHPDYAACSNDMRGRVQQYELLTNPPERFVAYIGKGGTLTTWTGHLLGRADVTSTRRTPHSFVSSSMSSYRVTMAGKVYHGRSAGEGMAIALRRAKV